MAVLGKCIVAHSHNFKIMAR